MKSSSKKKSDKNPADEYNQLVDELQDMTHPTHSTQGEDAGCDITSLKSRAQQLLVWITRHQDDVDRHDLAAICIEGKKISMKIMRGGEGASADELEVEMGLLEARQTACEQAFADDLHGFDQISAEIINGLKPEFQQTIRTLIAKAKINVYKSEDTPTGILEKIEQIHEEDRESRIDNIISETLDADSNYSLLRKSQTIRDELREYIRERQKHTGYKALVEQVKKLLNNYNEGCIGPSGCNYLLPRDINRFINNFNSMTDYLSHKCSECYQSKIDVNDFFPEYWSLYDYSNISYYIEKYNELSTIYIEFSSNLGKLIQKISWEAHTRKRGY